MKKNFERVNLETLRRKFCNEDEKITMKPVSQKEILQMIQDREWSDDYGHYSVDYLVVAPERASEYSTTKREYSDWILVREVEDTRDDVYTNYTLFYNPEKVIVDDFVSEETKKVKEIEERYRKVISAISPDDEDLRREVLKRWLQKRLQYLKEMKDKIEVTWTEHKFYEARIAVLIARNSDDWHTLVTVDDRFQFFNEDEINELYKKIFTFLSSL